MFLLKLTEVLLHNCFALSVASKFQLQLLLAYFQVTLELLELSLEDFSLCGLLRLQTRVLKSDSVQIFVREVDCRQLLSLLHAGESSSRTKAGERWLETRTMKKTLLTRHLQR